MATTMGFNSSNIILSYTVAYLLLGELGDGPGPFLDFSNNLGYAPPLWEVIFGEDYR